LGFLIDLIGAVLLSLLGLFVPACLDIICGDGVDSLQYNFFIRNG